MGYYYSSLPSFSFSRKRTALSVACQKGDLDIVKLLLNHDQLNVECQNDVCFSFFIFHFSFFIFHFYFDGSICILSLKDGWTPLHYACMKGLVGVVEALLKRNADVNATTTFSQKKMVCIFFCGSITTIIFFLIFLSFFSFRLI